MTREEIEEMLDRAIATAWDEYAAVESVARNKRINDIDEAYIKAEKEALALAAEGSS